VHGDRLTDWQRKFLPINRKTMFVLLAESSTELAGFACIFPEEDAIFGSLLDNLHVAPHLTGQGIGRQLLSESARRLHTGGSTSGLHLRVLEQNHRAQRFYEKAGGTRIGSSTHTASDGRSVIALRYYWPDLKSFII
jgi:ribosomal protein S18 acetylase RimI-like enzyme